MSARLSWSCVVLAVAVSWAGCSGDDDDDDAVGDGDGDVDGDVDGDGDGDGDGDCTPPDPPAAEPTPGQVRITVDQRPDGAGGNASAVFYDGPAPVWHDEVMREGDCRLLEYDPGFCEDCWDGICRHGECLPHPGQRTAGDLTITGLAGGDLDVDDMGGGIYYAALEDPDLSAGAPVGVQATGGEHPAFAIDGQQPAPFEAEIVDDEIRIENGADAVVQWTAADCDQARVRLTLKTPTAAHGLPPRMMIECDVPDTGRLTIPQAIVEAFPETAHEEICVLVDCPASTLLRYTRATTGEGEDAVELLVESGRTFWVVHAAVE